MASNTILVKCEMSQAMIFLYQKFTKSVKNCSQGFSPTSPGGILPPSPGKRSAIARFSSAFLMFGKPLIQFAGAVARFFVPGVSRGMLPRKIFKIKGPRLAKNAFPEISTWKIR